MREGIAVAPRFVGDSALPDDNGELVSENTRRLAECRNHLPKR
jgi:hypothetical protein